MLNYWVAASEVFLFPFICYLCSEVFLFSFICYLCTDEVRAIFLIKCIGNISLSMAGICKGRVILKYKYLPINMGISSIYLNVIAPCRGGIRKSLRVCLVPTIMKILCSKSCLEESPAPGITEEFRRKIGQAAVGVHCDRIYVYCS